MDLIAILELLNQLPPEMAYGVLFLAAMIEYVFPPFPGDTVVVAGTALVTAFGWPLAPVFTAVTLGAIVGGGLDFAVGAWLVRSGAVARMPPKRRKIIDLLVARFERYGAVYLAVNRFIPGVRAFFFIAAGLAGLRVGPVLFWALVSATAWNGLLVGLGIVLGGNVEEMGLWVGRHSMGVGVFVTLAVTWVAFQTWREVRSLPSSDRS
jgi:membrane-associated protein